MGEDLGPLSSKDLETLERQLDSSLKQIRSTRVLKFYSVAYFNLKEKITYIPNHNWTPLAKSFLYNFYPLFGAT